MTAARQEDGAPAAGYDTIIAGGEVLDRGAGSSGRLDGALAGGRIAVLAPALDPRQAREVLDARG